MEHLEYAIREEKKRTQLIQTTGDFPLSSFDTYSERSSPSMTSSTAPTSFTSSPAMSTAGNSGVASGASSPPSAHTPIHQYEDYEQIQPPSSIGQLHGGQHDGTNLIVNYVPVGMTEDILRALFQPYGHIERCKIVNDKFTGMSLGYGFVKYDNLDSASAAVAGLNGHVMANKRLKVSLSKLPEKDRKANLYLSGLPSAWQQQELADLVGQFGKVLEVRVLFDVVTHRCKGVGFARFETAKDAASCIAALNGATVPGGIMPLNVRFADTTSDKIRKAMASGLGSLNGIPPGSGMSSPISIQPGQGQTSPFSLSPTQQHVYRYPGVSGTSPTVTTSHTPSPSLMGNSGFSPAQQLQQLQAAAMMGFSPRAAQAHAHGLSPLGSAAYLGGSSPIANGVSQATYSFPLQSLPQQAPIVSPHAAAQAQEMLLSQAVAAAAQAAQAQQQQLQQLVVQAQAQQQQQSNPPVLTPQGGAALSALLASSGPMSMQQYTMHNHPQSPPSQSTGGPSSSSPLQQHQQLQLQQLPPPSTPETSFTGTCLFVYHLPLEASEATLFQLFSTFGQVTSAKVMRDLLTGRSKGFGFCNMKDAGQAQQAIQGLNGMQLGTKFIKVSLKTQNQPYSPSQQFFPGQQAWAQP